MADSINDGADTSRMGLLALAGWDDEGGAGPNGPQGSSDRDAARPVGISRACSDLTRLHARVIALEALTTALLSTASQPALLRIREMSAHITPRKGPAHHPITSQAAAHMMSLVDRSDHFWERSAAGRRPPRSKACTRSDHPPSQTGDIMTISRNTIILALSLAILAIGYLYYQSRQSVVEIKLPSVSVGKQP